MHRVALRIPLRRPLQSQRSFVSTVLLTKAWENEHINELRKEAKKRGLSPAGNKATLVSRLHKDDNRSLSEPAPAPSQARHASTTPAHAPTEVPGIPSTAKSVHPKYTMGINIPNISDPKPDAPVQIPFVPDLWHSSKIKHESVPDEAAPSTEPKLVVIAGETSIPGSAPSHKVYSPNSPSFTELAEDEPRKEPTSIAGRLAADMADDLGVPPTIKLFPRSSTAQFDVAAKTHTLDGQQKRYSRTLDEHERMGLWALLGVFTGSFIAASILAPTSEWAHKKETIAQDVQEKMAGEKH